MVLKLFTNNTNKITSYYRPSKEKKYTVSQNINGSPKDAQPHFDPTRAEHLGYVTLLAIFLKSTNVPSHQLNSKNNGPIFKLFKTIIRHWNCFLTSVATDNKDGHGLKLEKVWSTFSSFNEFSKTLSWLVLVNEICLISSYITAQEHFVFA